MSYVQVSREALIGSLEEAGFKPYADSYTGSELVYAIKHHLDQTMMVKVYTSLSVGGSVARGCGEDAIRVLLVFENGKASGCLYRTQRVFRTGTEQGVIDRVLERAREAYAAGTLRHQRCPKDQIEARAKEMAAAKTKAKKEA